SCQRVLFSRFILLSLFFIYSYRNYRDLHSFPTRRSSDLVQGWQTLRQGRNHQGDLAPWRGPECLYLDRLNRLFRDTTLGKNRPRSEEHTSELQSRGHLVCRLLLEKKKFVLSELNHLQPDH